MSDYMNFQDSRSQTVCSICITILDRPSSVTGKTAHQTSSATELLAEMFRQLQETYPNLPSPTTSLLSPTVYRDTVQGIWKQQDSAYLSSAQTTTLPSSGLIPNLFQVGAQNGISPLHITAFEAAVANAMAFVKQQYPDSGIYIRAPFEFRILFLVLVIVILIIIVCRFL